MNNGILSDRYAKPKTIEWGGSSKALYFALVIPIACMLFLLEWEPRVFVFIFLAYSAAVIGFLLARHFFNLDILRREEGHYFELMAEHSNEVLILHRMEDNSNVYISPSIEDFLGFAPDEILCKYGTFLLHPEDRKTLVQLMSGSSLQSSPVFTCTLRLRSKKGDYHWMEVCGKAIRDKGGQISHTLLSLRDATERKEVETATRQFAEELMRKNEGRHSGKEDQLALMISSHDLKEPLRTVRSYAKLLKEQYGKQVEPSAREYIYYISDGAERMENMLSDVLSFSSMGEQNTRRDVVDLKEVVEEVLANLNQQICESGATVSFEPLPQINVDPRQFRHLFQNLIQNAIKYCDQEHPFVQLSWIKSGNYWQFRIKDNGIGIKTEFQHHIFERFRRLHSVGEYKGSGLGLAICKQIVENHRGRIWVESEGEGKGSSFYFAIPVNENRNYASGTRRTFEVENELEETMSRV